MSLCAEDAIVHVRRRRSSSFRTEMAKAEILARQLYTLAKFDEKKT